MARLLVVEDDASIRQVLALHLTLVGYRCDVAEDALQARGLLAAQRPDLALLDVMLPGEDGFSLAKDLLSKDIPVLFLTAKTAVADRVRGLQMGAQDYILKPFEPAELLARVENILRRTARGEELFQMRRLTVDFAARRALVDGHEVALTTLEFDLLSLLVRRRNMAVSRAELLRDVWGYDFAGETHTVDVHIQRLRSKLGLDFIETVYKYGYRLNAPEENAP